MRAWAVVPAKDFADAKSRLSSVLDPAARAQLGRTLLGHVLAALRDAPRIAGIVVVTGSPVVADHAATFGAETVRDPEASPTLAEVVNAGIARARERGADTVLILMSDLPEVRSEDVDALLDELDRSDAVIVSDESGDHTNALGLRLTAPLPTHFGMPDSYRRHSEAVARAGFTLATPRLPTVAFDVDTADDLVRMRG